VWDSAIFTSQGLILLAKFLSAHPYFFKAQFE
jgi:hypothetical protein